MANWQSNFGTILLAGYQVTDEDPLERTGMEAGPDRVSLRTTHVVSGVSASLMLDKEDAADFRDWIKNDIRWGAEYCDDCPIDTGDGVRARIARLSRFRWRVELPDKLYRVTFQVETDDI